VITLYANRVISLKRTLLKFKQNKTILFHNSSGGFVKLIQTTHIPHKMKNSRYGKNDPPPCYSLVFTDPDIQYKCFSIKVTGLALQITPQSVSCHSTKQKSEFILANYFSTAPSNFQKLQSMLCKHHSLKHSIHKPKI